MKASRQVTILEVIHNQEIETQEELARRAAAAWISGHAGYRFPAILKSFVWCKALGPNGTYRYATAAKGRQRPE